MAAPSGICLKAGVFIRMMTLFKKSHRHLKINPRQPRSPKKSGWPTGQLKGYFRNEEPEKQSASPESDFQIPF
jgi:hypothetical protein